MSLSVTELVNEALSLPKQARAALAGRLIDSLEGDVDPDSESAWAAEIEQRVASVDSGQTQTVPWSQVRRRLLEG